MKSCLKNGRVWICLILLAAGVGLISATAARETTAAKPKTPKKSKHKPFGMTARTPWKTSQITGTPEPPPPFRAQRLFPKINFDKPTLITNAPATDRFFIAEQTGKIFSIPNDQKCEKPDLFLDAKELVEQMKKPDDEVGLVAVYGLTFHPNFAENRFCYVCYVVNTKGSRTQRPDGTRVTRLKVSKTDPPVCDPKSEKVVISWLQGGHNGGCVKFGLDGCLYVSTGDGGFAFPPDGRNSGQDVSNLLSSILRIDVDHPDEGRLYSIPDDNPFTDLKAARGEIWAYGVRNPWKMSVDRKTGDLWVGDVGWELWEMVYRVQPGANYGWSLVEGRQPVHTERERGPTPIVPPTIEIPHTDGASITGGFVYRGKKFPELDGHYIFGDWETRWIWDAHYEGDKLTEKRELVGPTVRIVGFTEDNAGEIYLLDYDDGTIHGLARNTTEKANENFPKHLSDTGLFQSVVDHEVTPGVVPFSINAEQWTDHAQAERFIAVPGTGSISLHSKAIRVAGSMFNRAMDFPEDSVLAKTLSLEMKHGDPTSRRRIETQILHYDGRFWRGYSYEWNEEQTDAALIGRTGKNRIFTVADATAPGGKREQKWHFSSRMECIRCHNPWAEHTLAFNIPQLNKVHDYGDVKDNQLRALRHIGLLNDVFDPPNPEDPFADPPRVKSPEELPALAQPYDKKANIDKRARAYLHANCAHCHRFNGGGAAYIFFEHTLSLAETKAIGIRPTQGTFGIHDAEILAPGDPYRSILYYRMSKLGAGRMPHIGSEIPDERAVELIHDWIRQLPVRLKEAAAIDQLIKLEEAIVLAQEKKDRRKTIGRLALQNARNNEREEPNAEDRRNAKLSAERSAADRVKQRAAQREKLIDELLSTTSNSLLLAHALKQHRLPKSILNQTVATAIKRPEPQIRDLFEQYVPADQRAKRLGEVVRPSDILKLAGNRDSGEALFHTTAGIQCRNCHRIGKTGKQIGPDLDHVGKKNDRVKLLESILEPSKNIEPKFATWIVETKAGRVHTGLLDKKTDEEIVLKDAANKLIRIPAKDVEEMISQRKSLMPELLLRDMTAAQVADLLVYLESLK